MQVHECAGIVMKTIYQSFLYYLFPVLTILLCYYIIHAYYNIKIDMQSLIREVLIDSKNLLLYMYRYTKCVCALKHIV